MHRIEHITSIGQRLLPRAQHEAYRQATLANNDARNDGRMELLVESGFTPLEAIHAATGTAATFFNRDRDLARYCQADSRMWLSCRARVMADGVWIDVARCRHY